MDLRMMRNKKHNHHHHHNHSHNDYLGPRPLDAYELYELEHKPHMIVKVPSVEDDLSFGATAKLIPDYYRMEGATPQYVSFAEDVGAKVNTKDVNLEAEKFISYEHHKFDYPNKWVSVNED